MLNETFPPGQSYDGKCRANILGAQASLPACFRQELADRGKQAGMPALPECLPCSLYRRLSRKPGKLQVCPTLPEELSYRVATAWKNENRGARVGQTGSLPWFLRCGISVRLGKLAVCPTFSEEPSCRIATP